MRCIALLCQCVNTIEVLHWCHCCCHYLSLANIRVWDCASPETCRYYEWRFTTPKNHVYAWSLLQICIYKCAIHILGRSCRHYTWRCGGVKLAAQWWSGGCGWWLCNLRVEFQYDILLVSIKKSRSPSTDFVGFCDFIQYKPFLTHTFMATAVQYIILREFYVRFVSGFCQGELQGVFVACCFGPWQGPHVRVWHQIIECYFQKKQYFIIFVRFWVCVSENAIQFCGS
jgi:hypothetical protein